jgi:ribosomal protein S18 acetylase RimI-like enzyme
LESGDRLALHPNISRRAVRNEDEEFLFQLYATTRAEELEVTGWAPEQKRAFLQMQFHAQSEHYAIHYVAAEFTVIEADGTPIGRLYIARWPGEIRIVDIALIPAYRNRGIGSRLISEIQAEAESARKTVTIHVEKFNPALLLYQRLGFRPKEDKGVYLLLQWEPADALGS